MFVVKTGFQEQVIMLWDAIVHAGLSQALDVLSISAAALHCVAGHAGWPLLCPFWHMPQVFQPSHQGLKWET